MLLPAQARASKVDPIIYYQQAAVKSSHGLPEAPVSHVDPLETALHELKPYGTYANSFAPFNCTWGVASRLPVTWKGNARDWPYNASMQGYTVSPNPKVGAIAVSLTDSYLGHVAVVVSLSPLTIWEENYSGLGMTDERVAKAGEFQSFIYF